MPDYSFYAPTRGGGTYGISNLWEKGMNRGPWSKTGTFKSQVERVRIPTRLRGAGWTIDYYDDITPSTMMVEFAMDEAMTAISMQLGPAMAARIIEIYEAGGEPKWKPVTPSWLAHKMQYGRSPLAMRTMHYMGLLEKEVAQTPEKIKTIYEPSTGQLVISGLDEMFVDAWYVWFHELSGIPIGKKGAGRLRRPFIMQGIMDALRGFNLTGASFVAWADEQATKGLKDFQIRLVQGGRISSTRLGTPAEASALGASMVSTGVPMPALGAIRPVGVENIQAQYDWWRSRYKISLMALIWWILPPHKILAVYGAAMDIRAFATGEMSDAFLKGWLFALAKGKAGGMIGVPTTRKMQRRAFRRRVWRGRA